MSRLMELPVTMEGHRPLVSAKINGDPALFELDSGAYYSIMSEASAARFKLKLTAASEDTYITGVGGVTIPSSVMVKTFDLGKYHLQGVEFLVVPNDFGHAGLIGQNFLAKTDVEYDLARGMIRLFNDKDCAQASLAYWAGNAFSMVKIEPVTQTESQTVGDITLNGQTIKATFDTGASTSILSLQAAARAGVRPGSPGVEEGGETWGIGQRRVRTWIGRFASIKIGDNEESRNVRIRFGDIDQDRGQSMLLGADFFLSHRVIVDSTNHRLFLSYNGGPVFDLSHAPEAGVKTPASVALAGPDPTNADGFSRRGAGYLARGDLPRALADMRQAVKLAPGSGAYRVQLASALLRNRDRSAALAELDAALALKHDELDALLLRGDVRAGGSDAASKAGARADADAFAAAAPRGADGRLDLGALYRRLHEPAKSVAALTDWLDTHPHDDQYAGALNSRCWVRALGAIELDAALDDCNRAVKLTARAPGVVDSRALVWFRKGDLARAKADYDMAIGADPRAANSLYMRGVVETRMGDKAAAEKDFAAAKAIDQDAGQDVRDWGIAA